MAVEITDDTVTIAVDVMGGQCDRLMKGINGIISNANASLECWKFNAPDDEDIQKMKFLKGEKDLCHALNILSTDNFQVELVKDIEQVKELLQDKELELDLNSVEFDKDGVYRIY